MNAVVQGGVALDLSLLQSKPLHVMIKLSLILYSPVNTQGRCLAGCNPDKQQRWGSGSGVSALLCGTSWPITPRARGAKLPFPFQVFLWHILMPKQPNGTFPDETPWGTSVYRTLPSVWLVITAECASLMDFAHRYFCFLTVWVVLKVVEPISAHPTDPRAKLGSELAPVVKSHSSLLDQASWPLLAGFTTRSASGGSCGSGSKEAFAGLGVWAGADRQWGRRAQRNW